MSPAKAQKVLDAIHGLARADWHQFVYNQDLCKVYKQALKDKRFQYTPDKLTCGRADCWTTVGDMLERYPAPQKILGDCEDFSAAYAAFLASQCYKGIEVGFVPGVKVSHAILAVNDGGLRRIIDPSRWYGMPQTDYKGAIFRRLSEE